MKERIQFLFIYFGFWVAFFLTARLIFLGYHINETKLLTLETLFGIFWNGIRMDMSMAGYFSIFPFFWVAFSNWIKKSIFERGLYGYTLILVFIVTLIIVVDLEVYNVWDYRLDATPLQYLNTPKEAFASVKSSPVFRLFLSYILLIIVASFFVYRIIGKKINTWKSIKKWPFMPIAIFMAFALIIPIRGGFGIAPMNQSTVYFSDNNFANISAVNASWNFLSSLVNKRNLKVNPYTYLPKEEISQAMEQLFPEDGPTLQLTKPNLKKPNVLLIIWESFTEKVVDESKNGQEITPNFNRLKKEGVYFSNVYASGDRTDKGIVAVLSGYPAQPTQSIIKEPKKTARLPILTKDFQKDGYRTAFYYGGETEFANMKSYLYAGDFEKIVDLNDFPEDEYITKWGVHDNVIFDKFLEDHSYPKKDPFFETLLTLSSHEPFDVPLDSTVIAGSDEESMYLNSLYYTDQEFGRFIDSAKTQSWWNETLVIVIGDHGHRLPDTGKKSDNFRTPMLWTGGAVSKPRMISEITSQIDLPKLLLQNLKLPSDSYVWSKNVLLKQNKPEWAYFSFSDGFGFIQKEKEIIFDNIGRKIISKEGDINENDKRNAKAMQQKTFQDYIDK
ncbi:LTA synthase family protein [Arcticibacterium luteifluviistationis]|uniref:Sulfatase n=1 Tax=Arcticibacterium luteifluviistationis TaxID=1784714 RepID=A0A2Z4G7E0_9BACT|nr:alkaline phosphatase family protein [Arcticibacterium luteifluviistationis]AWV97010.1 sulfatase [Arcticibacterium luteifluviistationis]